MDKRKMKKHPSKQSASLTFELKVSFCLDALTHRYQIDEIISPLPLMGKEQQQQIMVSTHVSFNCQQITEISTFQSDENSFPQLAHIFIIT